MIKIIFYTQPPPFRGTSCLRQLPNLLFASVLERFLDSLQFKLKILRRINVTGIFLFFADKRKKKGNTLCWKISTDRYNGIAIKEFCELRGLWLIFKVKTCCYFAFPLPTVNNGWTSASEIGEYPISPPPPHPLLAWGTDILFVICSLRQLNARRLCRLMPLYRLCRSFLLLSIVFKTFWLAKRVFCVAQHVWFRFW